MADASPPEIAPLPAVMSTEEVSELLGLTPKWTLRLAREGHLPGHQVPNGRRWVFRADEVLDAISSWSDAASDTVGQRLAESGDDRSASAAKPCTSGGRAIRDPLAITCNAPPRAPDQAEAEWLTQCAAAWVATATAERVAASDLGDGRVLVGDTTCRLSVQQTEVVVLDDYGEESPEMISMVVVEPVGSKQVTRHSERR